MNGSNHVTPLGRMRCARTACAPTCWSPSASRTQSAAVTQSNAVSHNGAQSLSGLVTESASVGRSALRWRRCAWPSLREAMLSSLPTFVCPQRCVVDAAHRSPRHEYVRPTRLQPLDAADKGAHDPWRTRHVAKLTITVQTPRLFNGRMSLLEGTTKLIKRVGPPSSVLVRTDERGQQRVLEAPGPAGPSWQCPPASASGAGPRPAELANRRPKPAPAGLGTGSRLELMSPLKGRRCPAEPGPARCWGGLSQGAESPMGIGDGGPSPSPASRGWGWG